MGVGDFLRRLVGGSVADRPAGEPAASKPVQARYDAAQTTDRNRRYWANADGLGPVAAHTPGVRHQLRVRARYEKANSGYLAGLVKTLAHDLIGSGPRLQLTADGEDRDGFRRVERAYAAWGRAVGLADKLRLLAEAAVTDGESFGVMATNDRVRHPVKLDLRLIECDRVAPPGFGPASVSVFDGIDYDEAGNPTRYSILRQHPGDWYGPVPALLTEVGEADWYDADRVVHWFRPDRPGQLRGVTQLAQAMTVSPQMRRLTLACLTAAETAASHAAILYTDQPPDPTGGGPGSGFGDGDGFSVTEPIPIEAGQLTPMPAGWKMDQLEAKHPNDRYKEFKGELINEMGRGMNAPFNVIAGNSAGYNYSSSRLDHRLYYTTVWCDRGRFAHVVADPVFLAWVEFAARTPGLDGLFDGLPPAAEWQIDWHWDAFVSIDPQKDATAAAVRLETGTTTLAEVCAADGLDWQEVMQQRAKERELAVSLGLPPDPVAPASVPPAAPVPPAGHPPAAPPADEETADAA